MTLAGMAWAKGAAVLLAATAKGAEPPINLETFRTKICRSSPHTAHRVSVFRFCLYGLDCDGSAGGADRRGAASQRRSEVHDGGDSHHQRHLSPHRARHAG